jgi:soluble lytic murein transglycosylase
VSARRTAYRPRARYAAQTRRRLDVPARAWRLRAAVAAIALLALASYAVVKGARHPPPGVGLPLQDASIIRAQAAEKHLDPALIAAVVYAESEFHPRTSSAGALGLMQILPETARFIARKSGGVRFTTADLATPQINLAYGSWYLRYLLDRYEGNETDAVAAYNAGLAHVDEWVAAAHAEGRHMQVEDIPFPETREYVSRVERVQAEYRAAYPRELGLT